MSLPEAVDRYTVMRLRKENNVPHELEKYEPVTGIVDKELIEELYKVNKTMWPLHEHVMRLPNDGAGKVAKYLLKLNGERSDIKAKIAEKYGGFKEKKTYA